jgi:hypothetical protein
MAKAVMSEQDIDTFFLKQHKLTADKVFDQTVEKSTLLSALKEKGKFVPYTDIKDLKNRAKHVTITGQAYEQYGKIDVYGYDPQTQVEWTEKHLAWAMRSYYHDRINIGPSEVFDYFETVKKDMMEDAPKLVEDQLVANKGPSDPEVEGFGYTLPASFIGSPGGIDKSDATNAWWRHHLYSAASDAFATKGYDILTAMYDACREDGVTGPDLILTTEEIFRAMEKWGWNKTVVNGFTEKLIAGGHDVIQIRQGTVVPSVKVPAGVMWFLKTDDFDIKVNSNDDMYMHPPVAAPDRPSDKIYAITKTLNIVWSKFRRCGRISGISVPSIDIS